MIPQKTKYRRSLFVLLGALFANVHIPAIKENNSYANRKKYPFLVSREGREALAKAAAKRERKNLKRRKDYEAQAHILTEKKEKENNEPSQTSS